MNVSETKMILPVSGRRNKFMGSPHESESTKSMTDPIPIPTPLLISSFDLRKESLYVD